MARHRILHEAWVLWDRETKLCWSTRLAHNHKKSVAQAILRWHIQQGVIAIPKSSNPQRIQENSKIFDFHLNDGEMEQIRQLDTGTRYSFNPTGVIINPLYVKLMKLFVK